MKFTISQNKIVSNSVGGIVFAVVAYLAVTTIYNEYKTAKAMHHLEVVQRQSLLKVIDAITRRMNETKEAIASDKRDIDAIRRATPDGRTADREARVAANERKFACLGEILKPYSDATNREDFAYANPHRIGKFMADVDNCNPQ